MVFGIALRGGEYSHWQYVGDETPRGGIDGDERWKHITVADTPDW